MKIRKYMLLSEMNGSGDLKDRKAEILRTLGDDSHYGIRMYIDDIALGIEWYNGRSEHYARDAAENYVLGIKNYERNI
jgi:hypothetical protein